MSAGNECAGQWASSAAAHPAGEWQEWPTHFIHFPRAGA